MRFHIVKYIPSNTYLSHHLPHNAASIFLEEKDSDEIGIMPFTDGKLNGTNHIWHCIRTYIKNIMMHQQNFGPSGMSNSLNLAILEQMKKIDSTVEYTHIKDSKIIPQKDADKQQSIIDWFLYRKSNGSCSPDDLLYEPVRLDYRCLNWIVCFLASNLEINLIDVFNKSITYVGDVASIMSKNAKNMYNEFKQHSRDYHAVDNIPSCINYWSGINV